jgi:hypothetical protein
VVVNLRKRLPFLLLVFLAAFAFRFSLAFQTGLVHDLQRREMERIAISLVHTGVYGNPYATETGPSAHSSPGYPLLLAGLIRLFGSGFQEEVAQSAFSCLLIAFRCALLTWFALRIGLGMRVAVVLAVLSTFWIGAIETELKGQWDAPATALLLLALFIFHYLRPLRIATIPMAILYGIGWGCALLFNSSTLFAMGALLVVEAYVHLQTRTLPLSRIVRNFALALVVAFLTLVPWAIRNNRAFGKPIFARTNFGLEMWLTYHEGASVSSVYNVRVHPYYIEEESAQIARLGEVEYNRRKLNLAMDWVRSHSGQAAHLILLHILYFWFPLNHGVLFSGIQAGLTLGCVAGLLLLRRIEPLLFRYLLAIMIAFPLVYYLDQWSSRYRYPIEWAILLCVAVAANALIQVARYRRAAQPAHAIS